MPRKINPVTVSIAGEEWDLYPPAGTEAFLIVPKLIGLVSAAISAAAKANINLKTLITDDGFNFSAVTPENLLAFRYVANLLAEDWKMISSEMLPVLLCKDFAWLKTNGTPFEYIAALGTALNFHAPYVFGDKQWSALKKLLTEESPEEESQPQETD